MTTRSPARWLAPLALLAALLAVLLMVTSTLGGAAGGSAASTPAAETTEADGGAGEGEGGGQGDGATTTGAAAATTGAAESGPRTYTVRSGDTLGAIAERTGVPVTRLQELNPDVDSQALSVGQTIRLRGGE